MSVKEQYWRYSLIAIIIVLGIVLFQQITPFLGGLLGADHLYPCQKTDDTPYHKTKNETEHCRSADHD